MLYGINIPLLVSYLELHITHEHVCICTGKTAAFILPILERLLFRPVHTRMTRVLILLPTRELAIQVCYYI